jgi:hypothetical protein
VPSFADKGVSHGQRGGSHTVVNLSFLDQSQRSSWQCKYQQTLHHSMSRARGQPLPFFSLLMIRQLSISNRCSPFHLILFNFARSALFFFEIIIIIIIIIRRAILF